MAGFIKGVRLVNGSYKYRFKVRTIPYQGDTGLTDIRKAQAWVVNEKARLKQITSVESLDAQHRETLIHVDSTPIQDSFDKFLSMLSKRERPAGKRLKIMQSQWGDFVQYLLDKKLTNISEIDEKVSRKYINYLAENGRWQKEIVSKKKTRRVARSYPTIKLLSNGTVNHYHITCKYVLNVLLRESNTRNPFSFKRLPSSSVTREVFSPAARQAIMDEADDFTKAIARMGLLTGKRRNEICLLEWGDIQMNGNENDCILPSKNDIREDGTRRKTTGTVPLSPELREFLEELAAARDEKLKVADADESKFLKKYALPEQAKVFKTSPHIILRRFKKMLSELKGVDLELSVKVPGRERKVSVLGIHSLRHTFIYNLAISRVPIDLAMSIVGHMCGEVHTLYRNHYNNADRLRALSETSSLFEPQPVKSKCAETTDKTDLVEALKAALQGADPADKMAIIQQLL